MPPKSRPPVRKIWAEEEIITLLKALNKSTNGSLANEEIKNLMGLDDDSFEVFKKQICTHKKYIDYEQLSTDPVELVWILTEEGQEFLDRFEEKRRVERREDQNLRVQKVMVFVLIVTVIVTSYFSWEMNKINNREF